MTRSAAAPRTVTPALLRSMPLPSLGEDADKEARGRVLVIGGSTEVPGALILAAHGAMRVGAGKLQIAAPKPVAAGLAIAIPEARVIAIPVDRKGELGPQAPALIASAVERADAVVIGAGMLNEASALKLVLQLLQRPGAASFVIDAAALTGLGSKLALLKRAGHPLVLTPHQGEMAALLDTSLEEIKADPLAAARQVARAGGAVVALKGKETWIAAPDGPAFLHRQRALGLGASGSGDVLSGVIGGLLARGAPPEAAAAWGVYLHGEGGWALEQAVGGIGYLAHEVLDYIAPALARLSGE